MPLRQKIDGLRESVKTEIAGTTDREELKRLYYRVLGRKGELTALLRSLSEVPPERRPELGQLCNQVKKELDEYFKSRETELSNESAQVVDFSLPGKEPARGYRHPIRVVTERVLATFRGLGFQVAEGPEIETDYYNFEALNFPEWHPARDMQDTFFIEDGRLLRTHTSPVQVRVMKETVPPVAIVAPGRVFRSDNADASHYPTFHQIEGLLIDSGISLSDLRGILLYFARETFGEKTGIRFRPSFFPFTEPSFEVDVTCIFCSGDGCGICKQTGWIEILGAGMVHPNVIRNCGHDPDRYDGFAFGLGIERVAMLKYEISDIRLFYENNLSFLRQFAGNDF